MRHLVVSWLLVALIADVTLLFSYGAWTYWGRLTLDSSGKLMWELDVVYGTVFFIIGGTISLILLIDSTYRVIRPGKPSEDSVSGFEGNPFFIVVAAAILPMLLVGGTLYLVANLILPIDSLPWIAMTALAAYLFTRWFYKKPEQT